MKKFIFYACFLIFGLGLTSCDLVERTTGDIEEFSPPAQATAAQAEVPAAQTGAVIRLQPATTQLNVGQTATIEIWVDNVVDLVAVELELRFNSAVLQAQDADPATNDIQIQPGNFLPSGFVALNKVNNQTGVINYAFTQLAPFQPVSGSGLLATITFQAVAPGSSDLIFNLTNLVNPQARPIPSTTQPGLVTVGGTGQPIVTLTPTPTLLPGQPTVTPTLILPTPPTPLFTPIPSPTFTPLPPTATPTPTPTSTNTPFPPQVVIPPGATVGFCYRVQPGDTLYSLGQTFNIDPHFINLANDLYPPGHIYPQKILFMPTQYGTGPNVYMVQPGDTLASIAEQCQLDVDVLAFVNKLVPDANLSQIPTLIIPRPPFAPPARYPYPQVGPPSVWPPPCSAPCYK